MKFTKIIKNYYVHMITLSSLITLIGFGLAITAEIKNRELGSIENSYKKDSIDDKIQFVEILNRKLTINDYGFTGLLMLFVGFLVTSSIQTYILFHTRKNPFKKVG